MQQPVHWAEPDLIPKPAHAAKQNEPLLPAIEPSGDDDAAGPSEPYVAAPYMYQMARVQSSFQPTPFHSSLQPSLIEFEPHRPYAFHSFEPYSPNRFSFDKKKRRRLAAEETRLLSQVFEVNPKPSVGVRDSLAHRLNMTPRAVQIWFQNRRAKLKRDLSDNSSNLSFCPHASAMMGESSESQPDYHHYVDDRVFANECQYVEERSSPPFLARSYSDSHLPGFLSDSQPNLAYPAFSEHASRPAALSFDAYSSMPKVPLASPQPAVSAAAAAASFPAQGLLLVDDGVGGSKIVEPMMAYLPDALVRGDSALEPSPDFSYQYQYQYQYFRDP